MIPSALDAATDDLRTTRAIRARVAEAALENFRERQAQFVRQRAHFLVVGVNHVAACLGVLPLGEAVVQRPHTTADAVARLDDGHCGAAGHQVVRRGKAGEPRAGDEDRYSAKRHDLTLNGNKPRLR